MNSWEIKLSLAIFGVVIIIPILSDSFFFLSTMVYIGIYSLIALGLSLLICYAGQISIAHGGFMAIGAYTTAILTTRYDWSPWLAMIAGVVITVAISYVIAVACLRLTGHYLAMATLGLAVIVNALLIQMPSLTGGVSGIAGIPGLSLLGLDFSSDTAMYYLIWALVLIAAIISCNIANSKVGRAVKAIQHDEIASLSFGINVQREKIIIFLFSTGLASVAGSLMAHFMAFVAPESFTLNISIFFLLMALLGGGLSPIGGIIGAVIIGGLPQVLSGYQEFSVGIFGIFLMLIMLFLPKGVLRIIVPGRSGK